MTPTTSEWVQKAEGDYDVVSLLLRSRKRSRYDAICFHSQQRSEKYLKARLIEASIQFPKTHDLLLLLNLTLPVEPLWAIHGVGLQRLTTWAAQVRYPGTSAAAADAKTAAALCRRFRVAARQSLGLNTP